ncbi:tyrosine-type recombinase/integrase [Pseudomonas sp. TH31]|uniref:tyrosine-type recombinase/integrase n=1 Tax=Pseudomonas sp. TH31 TaxID=2796396 RepID=UPI001912BAB4|nr:tyrosine-type recombinase/integrase [Pseudomonas sp. TH31]MBK5416699.1 tyrosine-type recombinase/integrase [Pseudomonas sp. TH31]
MPKANNLQLQGGTYHVRLDIPKDVQAAFGGRRILSQTLKTGSRSEALHLRLPILHAWWSQINAIRDGKLLGDGWQEDVVQTLEDLDAITQGQKRALVGETAPPLPDVDPAFKAKLLNSPRFMEAIRMLVGDHLKDGIGGRVQLQDELNKRLKDILQKRLGADFKLTNEQSQELDTLVKDPASYKARSPITKVRLASFRTYRLEHHVALKTVDQQESKLLNLSEHLQTTGTSLDFDSVSAWLQAMKLSSKTKQQYLLAGSQFWQWAMTYEPQWRQSFKGHVNPFEKHTLPTLKGKAKLEAKRKALTVEEVGTLYKAAKEQNIGALPDLILLGVYTGARIEELCQLRKEHLITVDGVKMFDIVDAKTVAGIRQVPLHPKLTALVDRLSKASTDGYLVPTDSNNKYGIRSDALSKAFGRLKTTMGFDRTRVFHSIRATVITQLVRADVPDRLINELVGHETGTVTFDVYSDGSSPKQKLKAISKLPTLTTV